MDEGIDSAQCILPSLKSSLFQHSITSLHCSHSLCSSMVGRGRCRLIQGDATHATSDSNVDTQEPSPGSFKARRTVWALHCTPRSFTSALGVARANHGFQPTVRVIESDWME